MTGEDKDNTDCARYRSIVVRNPHTHNTWEDGKYTTYEIFVDTNDKAFCLPRSVVKRRYSEFVWLRSALRKNHPFQTPPKLPPRQIFSDRFDRDFIEDRRSQLNDFLIEVVKETIYLSDSILHLFLQTNLQKKDIVDVIEGRTGKDVLETILRHGQAMARKIEDDRLACARSPSNSFIFNCSDDSCTSTDQTGSKACQPSKKTSSKGFKLRSVVEENLSSASDTSDVMERYRSDTAMRMERGSSSSSSSFDLDFSSSTEFPRTDVDSKMMGKRSKRVQFSKEVTVAQLIEQLDQVDMSKSKNNTGDSSMISKDTC